MAMELDQQMVSALQQASFSMPWTWPGYGPVIELTNERPMRVCPMCGALVANMQDVLTLHHSWHNARGV